jgi:transglutaminase-like putative cysteine protease
VRGRQALVLSAEVGLALITLAAVAGMQRLFDGGGWAGPLLGNAIAAHATAGWLRRRGAGLPLTAAAMAIAAGLVTSWMIYWSTTWTGIPTGATWTAMSDDLSGAWSIYQDVVAPAPVVPGFVLASALALWCIAYAADWAAFRLWVPFEASLPAGTLFLFTALLGTETGRGWAVALYASALLLFLLLHRMARQDGSSHWVAERRETGHRALLTVGVSLAIVAVGAGTLLGPAVPGADSPGILDPRELRAGNEPRRTISPLVDIQTRLVDQAQVDLFEVRSPQRSYWRLTSLDRFDGQIWSSSGDFGRAQGRLPESVAVVTASEVFDQQVTVLALAAIWLPSAYEPRAVDVDGVVVRYDDESATLIVDNDVETSDGLVYRVTSASPRLSSEDLSALSGEIPGSVRARHLGLPDDLSPRVTELARQLTIDAGLTAPADQARAIQDHLRRFTYDLDVGPGHSDRALETFLFETQRGYCEQFAGSFAAMARSIGLPARVAVGFTTGEADPDDPERFVVRGEHAHAWPEVYIPGAGWVAYEPTPGRGIPFAEPYTGVPEQQAASADPGTATTAPTTEPSATLPTAPTGTNPPQIPSDDLATGGGPTDPDTDDRRGGLLGALERVAPALAAVALLVVFYVLVFPLALLVRRARRRRQASTPDDRVDLAWRESVEAGALVGFAERPSDTHPERAEQLAALLPSVAPAVRRLAHTVEAVTYGPDDVAEAAAEEAVLAAEAIQTAAREAADRRAWLQQWLDPRPHARGWLQRRSMRQRRITTTARGDLEVERELVGSPDRG